MQNKEEDCQGHCLLGEIKSLETYFHFNEVLKHLLPKSSALTI